MVRIHLPPARSQQRTSPTNVSHRSELFDRRHRNLPVGAPGRHLPRQARRGRVHEADGMGRDDNSRPAVTRALTAVDEVQAKTTPFDKAGEGAKDRLFGRGRRAA
jgi:hypothetical protein